MVNMNRWGDIRIYWFTDDQDKLLVFGCEKTCVASTTQYDQLAQPDPDVDCLVINANSERNQRSKRNGLRWLQKVRREHGVLAPAIVYSFEAFDTLSSEYPILKTGGVSYIRLPFSFTEFNTLLHSARL